ncbi:MAG: disulfide oxidoreductase [Alphaproteobacteria bacterium]|nr:disulfide oxidoreductase [Alphaproteobacteria bacterium]
MALHEKRGRVRAVLGPTNTGKTYLAIDRMLGFPLRLLARENYDRIVALKGRRSVALITGEEKIVPPRPRWFVCTVESMPLDLEVDFLAIDEIQLCADRERGHVFTDRLLHARGREETMLLGADTIAPLLRQLAPDAQLETRPRFSTLSYTGAKKLTRLPRRTAIVAFSLNEVYGLAELIRRQRGGTAVVLGALSPRTRNAQVEMYQAGEVDYMVATDAIGMGLNMDIEHVAFAGMRKFDGRAPRRLQPAEIGQIAGRAGRYQHDGTFGVTNNIPAFDDEVVEAIESHQYDTLDRVSWRNRDFDFRSPRALLDSLSRQPSSPLLYRAREADDFRTLKELTSDADVAERATNPAAVRLLWDVCQIPDFRKVMPDIHVRLLRQVFLHLSSLEARLPEDWVGDHIKRLDNVNGDIDTLTQRIAHVRTWTYISHRTDWLSDSAHWQGIAREIEDRLSDALHQRLLQRFVDRRAPVLAKRRQGDEELLSFVSKSGDVVVEGVIAGSMAGLKFIRNAEQSPEETQTLVSAARGTIALEVDTRVAALCADEDKSFSLSRSGRIRWHDDEIASLQKGDTALAPNIVLLRNELLASNSRDLVLARLNRWLAAYLRRRLAALFRAREADLGAAARGIVFQLAESLGSVRSIAARNQISALDAADKKALTRLGLRFGIHAVYFAPLLRPTALRLRAVLAGVYTGVPAPRPGQAPSVPAAEASEDVWRFIGYRVLGDRAIRLDSAERLAAAARKRARRGPFSADAEFIALAGCDGAALASVLRGLGYHVDQSDEGTKFRQKKRNGGNGKASRGGKSAGPFDPASPFAKLRDMASAK